ncbi:MAG: toll/interleukin-1 receptor domain-containing protein [Nitrospirae bacterium]|nr:toll/interleukin-1 receptor domain-containing protein [Nitrospirota bacterium]
MSRYRFFVSYARKDRKSAEVLVKQLEDGGHQVLWDSRLGAGRLFTAEIQKAIQRCHFFIPVISHNSLTNSWVQQEIGYALACNVPLVPLVFDNIAEKVGMLMGIQGMVVKKSLIKHQLKDQLQRNNWGNLLRDAQTKSLAVFQCDSDDREKSRLIVASAQYVADQFSNVMVMQRSTLTSFSLPAQLEDDNWRGVNDKMRLYWLKPAERCALEELAKIGSCCLIIDPCYSLAGYRLDINVAKLLTLRDFFLSNLENDRLRVVVQRFDRSESEVIIEDHWMAHSAAVRTMATERETLSTWHAPTVRLYAETFQKEFDRLYEQQEESRGNRKSSKYAAELINCRLRSLWNCSTVPERYTHCMFQNIPES